MTEHIKVDFLKSAHVGQIDALLPCCLVASGYTASGTLLSCDYL